VADARTLEVILKATDRTAAGVNSAASNFGGLDGKLKSLASAATGALIIGKVTDYMWEAGQAALEDEAAAATLANTLVNVTGATQDQVDAVEDYISKTVLAAGVADDKLRPAFSNLVVATKDVQKAQDLMTIAMDVAQGKGLDLEAVTKALAKAQQGNVSGLQKLGVATKDASGKALSYEEILQSLADTYGGAVAKNAETAAGKQARLTLGMAEMKESIGTALVPVLNTFIDLGQKVLGWFTNLPGPVQKVIAIGALLTAMLAGVAMVIGPLIPLVSGLAAANMALLGPIAAVVAGIGAIIAIVVLCIKYHEEILAALTVAWNAIKAAFTAAWDAITGAFTAAWDAIKAVFWAGINFLRDNWQTIMQVLLAIATGGLSALLGFIIKHWDDIKAGFWKMVDAIKAAWSAAVDWIKGIPGKILSALGNLGGLLVDTGKAVIQGLWDGIKWLWENGVKGWFNINQKVKDFFVGAGTWLYDIGKSIIQGLWNGLKSIWESIKSWFLDKISWLNAILPEKWEIHSPSRVFFRHGANLMEGLRLGLAAGGDSVEDQMNRVADMAGGFGGTFGGNFAFSGAGSGASTIHIGSITIDGSKMSEASYRGLIESIQTAVRMGG
jgi:hypothetical protein